MINLSSRHVTIIAVVGLVFSLLVFFRYDIKPSGNGYHFYKLDRWTGTVTQCGGNSC